MRFMEMNFSDRENFCSVMSLSKFDPEEDGWRPVSQNVGNISIVAYTSLKVYLKREIITRPVIEVSLKFKTYLYKI